MESISCALRALLSLGVHLALIKQAWELPAYHRYLQVQAKRMKNNHSAYSCRQDP